MSYIVLARKYRPQTFSEVYAQDHITTILQNALKTGRIAHAYLFTGPRGVGKTSLARILAKSLNCEQGPTLTPCGVCTNCTEITAGVSNDVIEIDGASNTGVNDIRELQRELLYAPAQSKSKIYIIDEVHMLTNNAFNALLKTLEEPPESVIFIFATTEPHKVIPTIVSRCQRFDFKRIPVDSIVSLLKDVLSKEGISIDNESLYLIARKADGGMRDALSLMDQVLSYCAREVEISKVREIFGMLPNATYQSILKAISNKDGRGVIQTLHQVFEQGTDLQELLNNLMDFIRIVLLSKIGIKSLDINPDEYSIYQGCAQDFEVNTLTYIISVLIQTKQDIKTSGNPYLILEVVMLKLTKIEDMEDISKILNRLDNCGLQAAIPQNPPPQAGPKPKSPIPNPTPAPTPTPQTKEESEYIFDFSEQKVHEIWDLIVARIKKEMPSAGLLLEKNHTITETGNHLIRLKANTATAFNTVKNSAEAIQRTVSRFFKNPIRIDTFLELDPEQSVAPVLPSQKHSNLEAVKKEFPDLAEYIEITDSRIVR
ncbi:MAG: DNA polymerase III subunit gamma/tau [Candidatus Cloacimonetes bacterium]|nr:DNA polymerase III subunit gamma/tau [Candidatus Cloacimonadota bacterium]